jgi:hypothetical protein
VDASIKVRLEHMPEQPRPTLTARRLRVVRCLGTSRSSCLRSRPSTRWRGCKLMPRTSATGSALSLPVAAAVGWGETTRRSTACPARSPETETPRAAAA